MKGLSLQIDASNSRDWMAILSRYREPDHARSVLELVITALPFVSLWVLAWASLRVSFWLTLVIAVPAAAFLVRLFMIQHDCGHGALFRRRSANDWLGRAIGVVTLTPYDEWRRSHAIHHASSGNLERRGIGDIDTLTVREYLDSTSWGRARYRLYRHPLIMFGIGPLYLFLLRHRLPSGGLRSGYQAWLGAMLTNLGTAAVVLAAVWLVGVGPFLLVHAPIMMMAASIGVWLFYIQHQFEGTMWDRGEAWNHPTSALHGSSYYDLPIVLRWVTANIGIHHVHHLCSPIPFYRLPDVLRGHPELATVGRLTFAQSLGCVRLALWDESQRRLISFGEVKSKPSIAR